MASDERKKWAALVNQERSWKIFQYGERERERGFLGRARAQRFLTSALMLCVQSIVIVLEIVFVLQGI